VGSDLVDGIRFARAIDQFQIDAGAQDFQPDNLGGRRGLSPARSHSLQIETA